VTKAARLVTSERLKNAGADMNRAKTYDQELSEKLRNPKFAQTYLMGLMEGEDGLSIEEALRHAVKRMGVKEFSESTGIPHSNIQEFLKKKRRPKPETLNLYLKPFHLKAKLIVEKAS
jgi:DNA-binding phage protein